jgi:hypothetical protein
MYCPRCGSTRLRRSHTRGWLEKIAKQLSYQAYRCREPECDWRGLFRVKSRDQATSGTLAKIRGPLILMGVLLFSLTLFLIVVNLFI